MEWRESMVMVWQKFGEHEADGKRRECSEGERRR